MSQQVALTGVTSKCSNATSTKLSAKGSAGLTGASWFAFERDPELLAELYQAVPVKATGTLCNRRLIYKCDETTMH